MSDINIGAITEALNDKTDRDMQNVDITAGADAVVDYQLPTSENGYKWYRKYKSGWVEQGGCGGYDSISGNVMTINLPVEMAANIRYTAVMTVSHSQSDTTAYSARVINESPATALNYYIFLNNSVTTNNPWVRWHVSGLAA